MAELIVICGAMAQRPGSGGMTWVYLQYLLGFRRLGFDVLFLDDLPPAAAVDSQGRSCVPAESCNVRYVREVFQRYGLERSFSLSSEGAWIVGLPRAEVLERVKGSVLLLNVMGYLADPEMLSSARQRVFLDIDPGFGQMWDALGLADIFRGHNQYVTIGERIGQPGCTIPTCGIEWVTTPQPVVLEHWPMRDPSEGPRGAFTSVASWRGAFGPIEYQGRTYGLRVHEFRKFFELPRRTGLPFEVALNIASAEQADLAALEANGWRLVDPREAAGDPQAYQAYIAGSLAEFMVAKNMYVQTQGGWFSDRSICYLASGRPVLAQDTGLKDLYPVGEGLLTFSTLEEAVAGTQEIRGQYVRHARAARQLAEEYFDSDKVL